MKAMVLAAGLGTRLRPLTEHKPKALIPVNGIPLIEYSLRLLKKHGITDIVINLHHLGDMIQNELGDGKKLGLQISYSLEEKLLGTGGGIQKASTFFDEPFYVLNSDIISDVNLQDLYVFHKKEKAIATMVVRKQEGETYTPIHVSKNKVTSIGGDPKNSYHYTGIQILSPEFLKYLPNNQESCLIKQGYKPALDQSQIISAFPYEGYWNDLGTLDRYRQAEKDLQKGI